jgi:hypothetical protein
MIELFLSCLDSLLSVVLFRKLLIAKEFGVHTLFGNKLRLFRLFDSIGVSLLAVVVCASVL